MKSNVILIGMSGAGKSTLGVLLAKALGRNFLDTDIVIQQSEGRLLQEIIDSDGVNRFLELEEKSICSLNVENCVIATGGSVVYSDKAMKHLTENGTVIYLSVDFESLQKRLADITTRGIVFRHGGGLAEIYAERLPLYKQYADITLDCTEKSIEFCVEKLINALT